jgi:aminoglycoside phosphotransferase (APT) family kinase protein
VVCLPNTKAAANEMALPDRTANNQSFTTWVTPRNFQDDPGNPGREFVKQFFPTATAPPTPKAAKLCDLAFDAWAKRQGRNGAAPQARVTIKRTEKDINIGKCNVLFRLVMPDKRVWAARVRNPLVEKETTTALLESEVATMKYIKSKTRVPVPEIYAFDVDKNNVLGTPYIFMELMNGLPYPYPFSERKVMTDKDIQKVHNELININTQLAGLTFDKIGMLEFDKTKPDGFKIGPITDFKSRVYGPFTTSKDYYTVRARLVHDAERKAGKPADQLATSLLHTQAAPHAACKELVRGPFALKHNDMHWQNVLFNSKCDIVGVIDWEWSHTVPLESFHVIPFNLGEYAGRIWSDPTNYARIQKYEDMAMERFRKKAPRCAVNKTFGTPQRKIAKCVDNYNWPATRQAHAAELKKLIASVSGPAKPLAPYPPAAAAQDNHQQGRPGSPRKNAVTQTMTHPERR